MNVKHNTEMKQQDQYYRKHRREFGNTCIDSGRPLQKLMKLYLIGYKSHAPALIMNLKVICTCDSAVLKKKQYQKAWMKQM